MVSDPALRRPRSCSGGFLDGPAGRISSLLPGPTLFDLPGRDRRPLFVSTLLHGNETAAGRRARGAAQTRRARTCRVAVAVHRQCRGGGAESFACCRASPTSTGCGRDAYAGSAAGAAGAMGLRDRRAAVFRQHRHPQQHRLQSALQLHERLEPQLSRLRRCSRASSCISSGRAACTPRHSPNCARRSRSNAGAPAASRAQAASRTPSNCSKRPLDRASRSTRRPRRTWSCCAPMRS